MREVYFFCFLCFWQSSIKCSGWKKLCLYSTLGIRSWFLSVCWCEMVSHCFMVYFPDNGEGWGSFKRFVVQSAFFWLKLPFHTHCPFEGNRGLSFSWLIYKFLFIFQIAILLIRKVLHIFWLKVLDQTCEYLLYLTL